MKKTESLTLAREARMRKTAYRAIEDTARLRFATRMVRAALSEGLLDIEDLTMPVVHPGDHVA